MIIRTYLNHVFIFQSSKIILVSLHIINQMKNILKLSIFFLSECCATPLTIVIPKKIIKINIVYRKVIKLAFYCFINDQVLL